MKFEKVGSAYRLLGDEMTKTGILGHNIYTDMYCLSPDGLLLANSGYTWDGASGALDTRSILRASMFHDVLCEMINKDLLPMSTQIVADKLLISLIEEYWDNYFDDGSYCKAVLACFIKPFTGLRRKYIYRAVRLYQGKKKQNVNYRRKAYEV